MGAMLALERSRGVLILPPRSRTASADRVAVSRSRLQRSSREGARLMISQEFRRTLGAIATVSRGMLLYPWRGEIDLDTLQGFLFLHCRTNGRSTEMLRRLM